MNIIEVMKLPIGTKIKSNICNRKVLKICEQDGVKVLKFDREFRRIFLDNDVTEADYEIIEDVKCHHRDSNGKLTIEYWSTYEMRSNDMYCTQCKMTGSWVRDNDGVERFIED